MDSSTVTIISRGPEKVGLSKKFANKPMPVTESEPDRPTVEKESNNVAESKLNDESQDLGLSAESNDAQSELNDNKSDDLQLTLDSSFGSDSDTQNDNDENIMENVLNDSDAFTGFHENLETRLKPVLKILDITKLISKVENELLTEALNMPIPEYNMNGNTDTKLDVSTTSKKEYLENSDKENSFQENSTSDQSEKKVTDRPAGKRKKSENPDTSFDNMKLLSQVSSGVTDSNDSTKDDADNNSMEVGHSDSDISTQRNTKSFSSRHSGTESPATTGGRRSVKRTSTLDLSNPIFRKPFDFGWKRELVYRNSNDISSKIQADVYYYTPKNKKIRSNREVLEHLHGTELTTDNFTFFKDTLGVDDPEKEIIRSAAQRSSIGGEGFIPIKKSPKKKEVKEIKIPKEPKVPKVAKEPRPIKEELADTSPTVFGPKAAIGPRKGVFPRIKVTPQKNLLQKTPGSSNKVKKVSHDGDMEMGMLPPSWNPSANKTATVKRKAESDDRPISPKRPKIEDVKIEKNSSVMQNFVSNLAEGYNALLQVFQYLKTQELLRAARVCKMWRDLAGHRSLWRTVRLKNSHVDDWQGLTEALVRHGTQHLDLRKMVLPTDIPENEQMWRDFSQGIAKAHALTRIDLCRCPPFVVEDLGMACPQLITLNALTIKCSVINLTPLSNLKNLTELRLKSMTGTKLEKNLKPIKELHNLKYLAMTTIKEIGQAGCEHFKYLTNLETFELGECVDLPEDFGEEVLMKLPKLERLRLEKGQGTGCHTFRLLAAIKEIPKLTQLELINFDIKIGFDTALGQCSNIKRLLLIPTYVTQSATTNYLILSGATKLKATLSHFVWGVTTELLRVTELFVDQCDSTGSKSPVRSKKDSKSSESIPILKSGTLDRVENLENFSKEELKDGKSPGQVEIQTVHKLTKHLNAALPNTKIKIVKIPFLSTWKQTIADPSHH